MGGRVRAESSGPGRGTRFTRPPVEEAGIRGNGPGFWRWTATPQDLRPMPAIVSKLRRKLGDEADRSRLRLPR